MYIYFEVMASSSVVGCGSVAVVGAGGSGNANVALAGAKAVAVISESLCNGPNAEGLQRPHRQ